MIEIEDLCLVRRGTPVLDGVHLTVPAGTITYLLGCNGAGKSTLLQAVAGVHRPGRGRIRIGGSGAVGSGAVRSGSAGSGLVGAHFGPGQAHPGHTVDRHLRWVAAAAGVPASRVAQVRGRAGLDEVRGRRVGQLSLGWRQRLAVAAALLPDAPALVFDEPLNGLDVAAQLWFRGLIAELRGEGRALLIASHHLDEATRGADRFAVLAGGILVADADRAEFLADGVGLETKYLQVTGAQRGQWWP